jgi:hypothetical protein
MQDFDIDFGNPVERQEFIDMVSTWRRMQIIHTEIPKLVRSLNLNEYWWGVCLPVMATYSGHTPDELHDIFVEELLPFVIFRNYQDLTTTELSNEEMWAFIQKARHFFMKFAKVYIPDPNRVLRPNFQPLPNNSESFENSTRESK